MQRCSSHVYKQGTPLSGGVIHVLDSPTPALAGAAELEKCFF